VLHVLVHVAASPRPLTSEELAAALDTHPVVVRRTLAELRKAGYARSTKGHGGGWAVAVDLRRVTLFDVYEALGAPPLFAIGHRRTSSPCAVEQAVNTALDGVLSDAERLVVQRFRRVSVADLVSHFSERLAARAHKECLSAR
jgi:DNA-binding IscR family transcriptional regulator